jgi:hypothetical protein
MFPGATTFISTELVSNLEPVLLIRDPVAVLCNVRPRTRCALSKMDSKFATKMDKKRLSHEGGARCALNRKHCPKGQYARDFAITTNTAVGTEQVTA